MDKQCDCNRCQRGERIPDETEVRTAATCNHSCSGCAAYECKSVCNIPCSTTPADRSADRGALCTVASDACDRGSCTDSRCAHCFVYGAVWSTRCVPSLYQRCDPAPGGECTRECVPLGQARSAVACSYITGHDSGVYPCRSIYRDGRRTLRVERISSAIYAIPLGSLPIRGLDALSCQPTAANKVRT